MQSAQGSGPSGLVTVQDRIRNDFSYHKPPNEAQAARLAELRKAYFQLATFMVASTPPSRDQSVALTHLEESMRAANASVAKEWPVAETL